MKLEKSIWKILGFIILMAAVILTFTACDSDSGNEVMIKEVEDIPAVEVPYGTTGEEVISNHLPERADVELSSDETVTVNIGWEVPDDYSGTPENAPKTYTFEGSFSVEGEDLTGDFEVEVTVLEEDQEDPFTEDTVNISYDDLNLDDVDTVTSSDEGVATVEDDSDNNQIVITSVSAGSDITITVTCAEGNEATMLVNVAEDGKIAETVEPYGTEITDIATIKGTPEDGETLTAGQLLPIEATAKYKWQYNDGSGWQDLAEGESYTVDVEGDALSEGDDVRVVATGTGDYYGEVESDTVTIVVPEAGTITGTVTDVDTGDKIEGVTLETEVEGEIYSDTTDDNGDYTIGSVPPGEHEVKAEHDNYDPATETAPIIENDGDTVTLDFTLNESGIDTAGIAFPTESDPAVVQSGEVVTVEYEADDENFAGATLVVEGNGEEIFNDTVAQGTETQDIDLTGAAEGEYDITLTVTDTADNEVSVEEAGAIIIEETYTVTFDVNPEDAVVTFAGEELEGETVDVEPGTYDYKVEAEGYQTIEDTVEVIDEAVNITEDLKEFVELTITGYTGDETDIEIPKEIEGGDDTDFEIEEDLGTDEIGIVTAIEEYSLAEWVITLNSVVIPDSVTTIGIGAFYGLLEEDITLGDGYDTYFVYSEDGETLEGHIGSVEELDLDNLPVEVTIIGEMAFDSLSISSVTFGSNSNITVLGNYAFRGNDLGDIDIPDGVTSIGEYAFKDNQLINVSIPDSVTTIGNGAFKNNQLTNVTISNNVTSIGEFVFENNELESLNFEDNSSLESMGKNAFINSFDKSENTSIIIPDSVTDIGDYAFQNNNLNEVTISNSVTSIGHSAFMDNSLTSIEIPDSVETIETNAFYGNDLESISFGDSITEIGGTAFEKNSLDSITIPDSVTDIGLGAFRINELTSITIGADVTIGDSVVADDYNADNEFRDVYESEGEGTYEGDQTADPQGWTKQ